ncbi:major type 1 subunit fimbrin (pilin) [Pseudomonas sp. UC 17F4]|uniref:fimbrial protein n=1 Tax=Pseudomonas sp. UC 17F4 TaxID=1855328 RepID=UPI00088B4F65|nr:fimbrial protein [Pseudomonas sp. UC 17F4]SDQ69120.1 major type 1 subunit fimbrin (pilin) [Pseudomonas sp. UC 17F4]
MALKNITWPLLALILFANESSMAAICTPTSNFKTLILNSSLGDVKLDIPRDTPNGTTVYEKTMGSLGDTGTYDCSVSTNMGIIANPSLSTHATKGYLFELPGTGLSWFIKGGRNSNGLFSYDDRISNTTGSRYLEGDTYTLGLVKTGRIPTNTKIINGLLATYKKGDLELFKFYLDLTITHQSASCKSPDLQVNMGTDHTVSSLGAANPPRVAFNINLIDCPKTINKIHYMLKANTATIDASAGIVGLSTDSGARGVALQLFNDDNQPIQFDKNQVFTDSTGSIGGNFYIPLKAAYYRIPNESLTPGTANSSVTFIMSYL